MRPRGASIVSDATSQSFPELVRAAVCVVPRRRSNITVSSYPTSRAVRLQSGSGVENEGCPRSEAGCISLSSCMRSLNLDVLGSSRQPCRSHQERTFIIIGPASNPVGDLLGELHIVSPGLPISGEIYALKACRHWHQARTEANLCRMNGRRIDRGFSYDPPFPTAFSETMNRVFSGW